MTSSAQNSKQYLAQQGSAAVPAYSFLGDQDTGIYRSGANELSIATNGSQRVVVNSSGNVGIGTSSPSYQLDVVSSGANSGRIYAGSGGANFYVTAVSANANLWLTSSGGSGRQYAINSATDGALAFYDSTATSERMRIDSSGNFLVGTTDSNVGSGVGVKLKPSGATGCVMNDGASALNTLHVYNENATNNGFRFYVNTNGGIYNYSANNVNLSDVRTKKDIENAGPYLAKICAIPVRTFRYKDQDGDWTNVGVIAQEVEAVAPELVDQDGWMGDVPDDGVPLKAIYQTDLTFALMKSIQELKTQLDDAKNRIAALEAA